MTQDLNETSPTPNESLEPLAEPSPVFSQPPRVSLDEMKSSHKILEDFREAVAGSTIMGRDARAIALGLDFLGRMLENSRLQIDWAKRQEKDLLKQAKEAIKAQGGTVNGEDPASSGLQAAS